MMRHNVSIVTASVLKEGVFNMSLNSDSDAMKGSYYDPIALRERAQQWRDEAHQASSEAVRTFCLAEANECDRRWQMSVTTPVLQPETHPGN